MVEAVRELHEVDARLRLRLCADLTDDLVEVAARAVLEDEINVPLGRLDLVQPHHVRVLRRLQDGDFRLEILLWMDWMDGIRTRQMSVVYWRAVRAFAVCGGGAGGCGINKSGPDDMCAPAASG